MGFSSKNKFKEIVTCTSEHKAVLDTCSYLENYGVKVKYIDVLIAKYLNEEDLIIKEEKKQFLINEINFKINSIEEELIDVNDVEKLIKIDDYNITYYQEVLTKLNDNILDKDYYDIKLQEYLKIKSSTGIVLDELGLNRYCCRRCFISCVELVNII